MPSSGQAQFQTGSSHSPQSATQSYSEYSGRDSDSDSNYSDTEGGGGRGRRGKNSGLESPERGGEGKGEGEGGGGKYVDDLFEPFSPVNSPDHLFDLSDEEGKRSSTAAMGYPVEDLSDEEIAFEGGDDFDMQEEGFESYMDSDDWATSGVSFNPYQCFLASLESYPSLIETPHEALMAKLQKTESISKRSMADEAMKLRDVVINAKDITNPTRWVETMEEIPSYLYPGLAQLQKKSSSEGKEVMQKLASWTVQCLSLELARQSPMAKHNVMEELCDIALSDPMVSTIKLHSLRALDSLLDYPQGLERFIGWSKSISTSSVIVAPLPPTPYQHMINFVLSQPPVRVVVAASVLLAKAHIYELLSNLQDAVEKVVACTPVKNVPEDYWSGGPVREGGEEEKKSEELVEGEGGGGGGENIADEEKPTSPSLHRGDGEEEMDQGVLPGDEEDTPPPVPPELITRVARCLEELKKCIKEAPHTTSFPTRVTYSPESPKDYFPALMRMFQSRRLLECVLVLVTAPATSLDERVFGGVRDLLLLFLTSQEGVLFLSSNVPVMNTIVRTLTQASENQLALMQSFTELVSGGERESCTPQNLGVLLIYHLQVLQSLDQLRRAPKSNMSELESTECVSALHTLYTMTLTPIGKSALTYMMSLKDNISALFPFIESRGQKEHDSKLTRSSVSSRYAAVIFLQLLQSPVLVRGDFIISYSSKLLSVAEFFKENPSPTMSDLYNWLYPVRNITSDGSSSIPTLVSTVQELLPQISSTKPNRILAPILSSLRILLTFIVPPPTQHSSKGGQKELKWSENTVVLFSTGAMETLQNLLQKISDLLLPLWSQRQIIPVALSNNVSMVATFALRLMRAMLGLLVEGEDSFQYRDMRVVTVLVTVHAVFCSIPYSTIISSTASEIQASILDILAMFTKPEITEPEAAGEEKTVDASTSCWCLMLQELFNLTLTSPNYFLSGLMLLSELLPLPLPVHAVQPCSDSDIVNIGRHHTLWALHLDPFVDTVSEIVSALLRSSCPELLGVLRRVCAQLSDLSPPLATLVARYVIKAIIGEIERQLEAPEEESRGEGGEGGGRTVVEGEGEGGGEEERMDERKTCLFWGHTWQYVYTSCLLRMLTTCAVLSQQVAFKIALLDLLRQKETDDTKSFSRFIPLLLFLMQKKETISPLKICIITILNSLCSVYIALSSSGDDAMGGAEPSEQQQADCLPGQSQLEHITSAVVGHVISPDNPLTTVMQGLKVVLSVAQYNAGQVQLLSLMKSGVTGFSQLLVKLMDSLRKGGTQSSVSLECLSLLLSVYRCLLSASLAGKIEVKGHRGSSTESVSLPFPRSLLRAVLRRDVGEYLLVELREMVQELYKEDSSLLDELLAPISLLTEAVEVEEAQPSDVSLTDLPGLDQEAWPDMRSLKTQFEQRSTVMVTEDLDRSPEFWLATPPHDESDFKPDTTTINLTKLAYETIPGLNLEEELKKRLLPSPPPSPIGKRKRKIILSGPEAQKKLREAIRLRQASGRGKDLFRARKQNTSRPPSMHVDDFMAMGARGVGHRQQYHGWRSPLPPAHHAHHGHQTHHPHSHTHHPGSSFMHQLGGRWQMSSLPTSSLHYPRRDLGGLNLRDWESARLSSFMMSMKPPPLRAAPLWPPQLTEAYRTRSRLLPWPESSSRSLSSDPSGAGSSTSRMADLAWKARHSSLYKRLL
ncbi:Protein virilizer homolog [Geodia barretti]|nr:Protein virilizer homolog [Geodia barretti]